MPCRSSPENFSRMQMQTLNSNYGNASWASFCNWASHVCSGVTRVGVTRGGNWRCHPSILQKTDDLFSRHCHFFDFTQVSPPGGCQPGPFLPVRPCFSTFLSKFSHIFSFGCHPWRVSYRAVLPLSDAIESLNVVITRIRRNHEHRPTLVTKHICWWINELLYNHLIQ